MANFLGNIFGGQKPKEIINNNESKQNVPESKGVEKEINVVQEAIKNGFPKLAERISIVMKEAQDEENKLTSEDLTFLGAYAMDLIEKMKMLGDPEYPSRMTKEEIEKLCEDRDGIKANEYIFKYLPVPPQPSGKLLFDKDGNVRKSDEIWRIYSYELIILGLNPDDSEVIESLKSSSIDHELEKEPAVV
ncbi:MAG: hypothetical protein ACD_58C00031G0005 [uncultured bacterium]|nr:MAG: hypothetical protein ACD_58C00031G0005 [uncultured bacterium]